MNGRYILEELGKKANEKARLMRWEETSTITKIILATHGQPRWYSSVLHSYGPINTTWYSWGGRYRWDLKPSWSLILAFALVLLLNSNVYNSFIIIIIKYKLKLKPRYFSNSIHSQANVLLVCCLSYCYTLTIWTCYTNSTPSLKAHVLLVMQLRLTRSHSNNSVRLLMIVYTAIKHLYYWFLSQLIIYAVMKLMYYRILNMAVFQWNKISYMQ